MSPMIYGSLRSVQQSKSEQKIRIYINISVFQLDLLYVMYTHFFTCQWAKQQISLDLYQCTTYQK